ncbi:hypothetical protein Vadar_001077 [Vaccinium darrowii]|uniref:Uncharacterized protein n=1 Tax=Vaccinium darrowii TaxID=229202 RepID=A0ACB7XVT2_9ERIC|nr:hypothetical protein Vadar_001077 [Vaccinium darrowii]
MRLRSAVEEVENDQVSDRIMTRSASNQKKFANRRMTRSSFKQQQEQKGGEKPQQQKQQQQQQKKKRKREKKKMTPFADDPTKVIRTPNTGGKRYMRYFTPEEREAYHKKYIETEGFDMGKYPFEVTLSNPIREISLEKPSACSLDSLEGAKMAIRDYNRKNRTKYQFAKLVRVCLEFCTGIRYYITFQAKQNGKSPSPPCNFQACVKFFLGLHVEFCREEKKPNLTEGSREPSQQ